MAYPAADPRVTADPKVLTPAEQEEVDRLYEELKPQATEAARNFVLARTPVPLQEAMIAKIDADWPAPPVTGMAARTDQSDYQRVA